ncbi:MAG: hypothetical protein JWR09_1677 [Mucilaginibacter sp.]|nr:hypothetical protein [Mucilaginibacter sp.]
MARKLQFVILSESESYPPAKFATFNRRPVRSIRFFIAFRMTKKLFISNILYLYPSP